MMITKFQRSRFGSSSQAAHVGLILLASACTCITALAQSTPTLYGVTGSGGNPSSLYTVDPQSGVTALVGPTGFSHVTGIDFDPTTGILYGVISDSAISGVNELITIDPFTGVGTVVGPTGFQISDITIGPDGILRGWTINGDSDGPVTIDKQTGTTTLTPSIAVFRVGVATAGPETLYVSHSDTFLDTVDVTTGADTFVMNTFGLSNILENVPDGTLIGGRRDSDGTQLYHIDPANSIVFAIGHTDVFLSGVAYTVSSVPEPSTLTLIALAGLGACGLRVAPRRGKH
jgi:hypothetical protein